jgi:hypothetical protein
VQLAPVLMLKNFLYYETKTFLPSFWGKNKVAWMMTKKLLMLHRLQIIAVCMACP